MLDTIITEQLHVSIRKQHVYVYLDVSLWNQRQKGCHWVIWVLVVSKNKKNKKNRYLHISICMLIDIYLYILKYIHKSRQYCRHFWKMFQQISQICRGQMSCKQFNNYTKVTTFHFSLEHKRDKITGVLYNSLRLIRLFNKISKIEEKIIISQMVTHLSTVQTHGCLTVLIWPLSLTAFTFGLCLGGANWSHLKDKWGANIEKKYRSPNRHPSQYYASSWLLFWSVHSLSLP